MPNRLIALAELRSELTARLASRPDIEITGSHPDDWFEIQMPNRRVHATADDYGKHAYLVFFEEAGETSRHDYELTSENVAVVEKDIIEWSTRTTE